MKVKLEIKKSFALKGVWHLYANGEYLQSFDKKWQAEAALLAAEAIIQFHHPMPSYFHDKD